MVVGRWVGRLAGGTSMLPPAAYNSHQYVSYICLLSSYHPPRRSFQCSILTSYCYCSGTTLAISSTGLGLLSMLPPLLTRNGFIRIVFRHGSFSSPALCLAVSSSQYFVPLSLCCCLPFALFSHSAGLFFHFIPFYVNVTYVSVAAVVVMAVAKNKDVKSTSYRQCETPTMWEHFCVINCAMVGFSYSCQELPSCLATSERQKTEEYTSRMLCPFVSSGSSTVSLYLSVSMPAPITKVVCLYFLAN